jgi:hypothetical protein
MSQALMHAQLHLVLMVVLVKMPGTTLGSHARARPVTLATLAELWDRHCKTTSVAPGDVATPLLLCFARVMMNVMHRRHVTRLSKRITTVTPVSTGALALMAKIPTCVHAVVAIPVHDATSTVWMIAAPLIPSYLCSWIRQSIPMCLEEAGLPSHAIHAVMTC